MLLCWRHACDQRQPSLLVRMVIMARPHHPPPPSNGLIVGKAISDRQDQGIAVRATKVPPEHRSLITRARPSDGSHTRLVTSSRAGMFLPGYISSDGERPSDAVAYVLTDVFQNFESTRSLPHRQHSVDYANIAQKMQVCITKSWSVP